MGAAERYEARAALSLDRRGHTIARPQGTGSLRAAGARVDLTPALGVDTAGFGFIGSQHSRGLYGRLWATVLLIEGADGGRMLLVATDLLAGSRFISEHLGRELGPDLGLGVDRIWMGASHTHSGPGHYFGDRFYDCLAARTNDFDADTARFFVRQIAHAARRAADKLVPARIGTGSQTMWGSVWNRSFLPFAANFLPAGSASDDQLLAMARDKSTAINGETPPEGLTPGHLAVDARVQVLWVEGAKDRRPLGCFAIWHGTPTVLPAHMALLSSDVAGVATRHVHRCLH
ncbi:MAG: neutral ceramidase, partial [Kiritimatiellia bacterium]